MTFQSIPGEVTTLPVLPKLKVLMVAEGQIASTAIIATMFDGLDHEGAISFRTIYENVTMDLDRRQMLEWADIVFFFRASSPGTLSLLRLAKKTGKGTIFSTDDDFLQLDKQSILGRIYHAAENADAFRSMFREADLVWLFTEEMAKRYRPFNPRVVLGKLPSPFELFPINAVDVPDDKQAYTIGYAGGFTHQKDFHIAIKPLLDLLRDSSLPLRLEFVGYMPDEFRGHPKVKHFPYFEKLANFYSHMIRSNWSLGLALLEDTTFNRGKTNNKYREFAAFGVPGIYSDMPVYSSCVNHLLNGYLTSNTEEGIAEALSIMLRDDKLRHEIRKRAMQDVTSAYSLKAAQLQLLRELSSLAIEKLLVGKPRLLVVGYDRVPTTHIDALQPCCELRRRGLIDYTWKEPGQVTEQDIDIADSIYLVRAFEAINLPVLEWAEQKRKTMICSWDDNFFTLPQDSPLGRVLAQEEVQRTMQAFLRKCSLIMASTSPLAAYSCSLNQHVMEAIYGFAPPKHLGPSGKPATSREKVLLGFFGQNQGLNEQFVREALRTLRNLYHDQIVIEVIGMKPSHDLIDVVDSYFDRVLDYDRALSLLKSRDWDIGLAPLSDTEFNSAKQATKFRDYAWCGVTMVASDVPSYRRTIVNGIHGILVQNTAEAWVEGIVSLIENREKRQFLAEGARQLLECVHMQDKTIASWYQLIWRIMKFKADRFRQSSQSTISPAPSVPFQVEIAQLHRLSYLSTLLRGGTAYRLVPHHSNWNGLDMKVNDRLPVNGVFTLRIISLAGHVLRTISIDGTQSNQEWVEFRFHPIANSSSIPFLVELTSQDVNYDRSMGFRGKIALKDVSDRLRRIKHPRPDKLSFRLSYGCPGSNIS